MGATSKSILFISTMNGDPWGGSEEFWFRIAKYMAEKGYEVHCTFYDWPTGKEEEITTLKNADCQLTLLTNPKCAGNFFDKINRKRIVQKELIKLLQQPYDLVCISQGGFEEILHPPFRKILPLLRKFVLIYHNYNENRLLSTRRKQRLSEWTHAAVLNMGAAAKIFSSLKNIADFGIPNQMVIKNPLTIALQNIPCSYPPLNENGNYCWVVMAQLDTKRKAQDILVKALSTEKWKHRNWELFLYGAGEDSNLLAQLIESSPVKDKIHLMGHTKAVEKILRQSHLLLQVTHIDAMPLSVTEAMNMARPCVVSNVGDMPLWINEGINGFITDEVNETAIDEVLEKAWNQRGNWQQMGEAAFNTFQKKYPQPYEAFYEKILVDLMGS